MPGCAGDDARAFGREGPARLGKSLVGPFGEVVPMLLIGARTIWAAQAQPMSTLRIPHAGLKGFETKSADLMAASKSATCSTRDLPILPHPRRSVLSCGGRHADVDVRQVRRERYDTLKASPAPGYAVAIPADNSNPARFVRTKWRVD